MAAQGIPGSRSCSVQNQRCSSSEMSPEGQLPSLSSDKNKVPCQDHPGSRILSWEHQPPRPSLLFSSVGLLFMGGVRICYFQGTEQSHPTSRRGRGRPQIHDEASALETEIHPTVSFLPSLVH